MERSHKRLSQNRSIVSVSTLQELESQENYERKWFEFQETLTRRLIDFLFLGINLRPQDYILLSLFSFIQPPVKRKKQSCGWKRKREKEEWCLVWAAGWMLAVDITFFFSLILFHSHQPAAQWSNGFFIRGYILLLKSDWTAVSWKFNHFSISFSGIFFNWNLIFCKRLEREITIRFQENANRKV